ncbi:MAG TPA: hypothetical protein VFA54_11565 [Bryobacterales bacterium]|jgi:predicted  nucleic acid-binding Zn-ribbon protein|nr:hypothetical protein [Bryobacterales bacterium]
MQPSRNPGLPPLIFAENPSRRKKFIRGAAWASIAALLGVGAYRYSFPEIRKQADLLARLPGLQQSAAAAQQRIRAAEDRLAALSADQDGVAARVTRLESRVTANLQTARKQTQEIVAQAQQHIEAEHAGRMDALQARLGVVEASQGEEQTRLVQLQNEVSAAREQIARQSQQIAFLQQETGRQLDGVSRQVARLDRDADRERRNLGSLSAKVERKRIDFEIAKNHSREVAPGVTIEVTRIDVGYRKFDGWIWLLPDRRTVWVRQQSAQRPVIFYTKDDNRPRELVITHVTKNSVAGYLLAPAPGYDGSSPDAIAALQ